eukprot:3227800-Pyramimonas_sp.AAC.1
MVRGCAVGHSEAPVQPARDRGQHAARRDPRLRRHRLRRARRQSAAGCSGCSCAASTSGAEHISAGPHQHDRGGG